MISGKNRREILYVPGYTQSAERAIKIAIKWAKKMGGMAAGTEHLLIGLAECDESTLC